MQREIIFGAHGAARSGDPDTSHDAAESVRVAELERAVLRAIHDLGGKATSEDVAIYTGIDLQSITPRFAPLARKGVIARTSDRKPGRSGKARIVWMKVG